MSEQLGQWSTLERITEAQKAADNFDWYRRKINKIAFFGSQGDDTFNNEWNFNWFFRDNFYQEKSRNYDLFNGIIDPREFDSVTHPFVKDGSLRAEFTNRDILSPLLKIILGMEQKMPLNYDVKCVNPEAINRKQKEYVNKLKDFVIAQIMQPIELNIRKSYEEQTKGRKLSNDELQQLEQQIQEQIQAATPEEIHKIMQEEYRDPYEIMMREIMKLQIKKLGLKEVRSKAWFHGVVSGGEAYWMYIKNKKPVVEAVNMLYFYTSRKRDSYRVEDCDWWVLYLRKTFIEIVAEFSDDISKEDLDFLEKQTLDVGIYDAPFDQYNQRNYEKERSNVRAFTVVYNCWKGLRKVGKLTYVLPDGTIKTTYVFDTYKKNSQVGDQVIEWEWIPCYYQGYCCNGKYWGMKPVPGQFPDETDPYKINPPFFGIYYDDINSKTTSITERGKAYQYLYNIAFFRFENQWAKNKGKVIVMDSKLLPGGVGSLTTNQTFHFLEQNNFLLVNSSEEGNELPAGYDINRLVGQMDMSTTVNMKAEIETLAFLEQQLQKTLGITDALKGQTSPYETATNNRQNLVQTGYSLQPYFTLHDIAFGKMLSAFCDFSRVVYIANPTKDLDFVLSDTSLAGIESVEEILASNTYGLYYESVGVSEIEARQSLINLSQSLIQGGSLDVNDLIKILKSEDIKEIELYMKTAIEKKKEEAKQLEQQKYDNEANLEKQRDIASKEAFDREKELIILAETEKRKTAVEVALIKDNDDSDNLDEIELKRDQIILDKQKHEDILYMDKQKHNEELELEKQKHKDDVNLRKKEINVKKQK
jgi:hypothetical protein